MKFLKILTVIYSVILLGGCATASKVEDMTYLSNEEFASYDPALKSQVNVADVKGGKETNPLWSSQVSNQSFTHAVSSSLNAQGLFSSSGRYLLAVELIKLKQPYAGLNMTVTSTVKYRLTDSHTNSVIMDETVESPYTATMGDAMYGVKRLQLANEGAMKANIQGLLLKLSALQISPEDVVVEN